MDFFRKQITYLAVFPLFFLTLPLSAQPTCVESPYMQNMLRTNLSLCKNKPAPVVKPIKIKKSKTTSSKPRHRYTRPKNDPAPAAISSRVKTPEAEARDENEESIDELITRVKNNEIVIDNTILSPSDEGGFVYNPVTKKIERRGVSPYSGYQSYSPDIRAPLATTPKVTRNEPSCSPQVDNNGCHRLCRFPLSYSQGAYIQGSGEIGTEKASHLMNQDKTRLICERSPEPNIASFRDYSQKMGEACNAYSLLTHRLCLPNDQGIHSIPDVWYTKEIGQFVIDYHDADKTKPHVMASLKKRRGTLCFQMAQKCKTTCSKAPDYFNTGTISKKAACSQVATKALQYFEPSYKGDQESPSVAAK